MVNKQPPAEQPGRMPLIIAICPRAASAYSTLVLEQEDPFVVHTGKGTREVSEKNPRVFRVTSSERSWNLENDARHFALGNTPLGRTDALDDGGSNNQLRTVVVEASSNQVPSFATLFHGGSQAVSVRAQGSTSH